MGQFKPMVKMETTEPSVILKLKKGGHVNMKKGGKAEAGHKKMAMGGGAMEALAGTPALVGRPAVNAPVRAPGKPSMAARRKAMMAKPAMPMGNPAMPAPMKKGGKAEGGKMDTAQDKAMIKKAFKQHDMQEHKGGKGTDLKLKKGGMKKATGGVTNGQGGYKKGGNVKKFAKGGVAGDGIINTESQGGAYRNTKMVTAEYTGKSSGKTGGVKNGNGGGYATGGVALGNGGGYKMGGKASKKAYATGGTVNSGKPVAMPQGAKKPSTPVSINQLSGTFKKGGKVTPAEGRLRANNQAENATAMKQAKAQSNDIYSKYQKMQKGGSPTPNESFFDKNKVDPKSVSDKASRELEDAMNPLGMVKELYGKARDAFRGQGSMSAAESNAMQRMMEDGKRSGTNTMDTQKLRDAMMKSGRSQRDMDSLMGGQGAITETERSVTLSPAGKKRGGRAC
jgi:hypothetical protein